MYKCPKCGVSYPKKIYNVHVKMCNVKNDKYEQMTHDELKSIAKERGIDRYWFKSDETLVNELQEGDS